MPRPCCCQECVEGEEPTAAFSYEQTGDDPCTIDLFDESTVHENCDGEIVQWKWYLNEETTPFSTSQNPTDVEVEDGDDLRLWVKDSCGCTDEVVMAIACEDTEQTLSCGSYDFTMPTFLEAVFPSISNGTCLACDSRGGTRILKLDNSSVTSTACGYRAGTCCQFTYNLCYDGENYPAAGVCPDFAITGWTADIFVPTDGVSDGLIVARLATPGCGSADLQWRTTFAWRTDFTTFSEPALSYTGTSGNCTGTAGSTVAVSA